MNLLKFLSLLTLVGTLSSCMPLPQTHITAPTENFRCSLQSRTLLGVNWKSPTRNRNLQAKIDEKTSFAISPEGKRYQVRVIYNEYSNTRESYWMSAGLQLVDKRHPESKVKWKNGVWKIHIAFTDKTPRKSISYEASFSTFYYNPLLHGAPN